MFENAISLLFLYLFCTLVARVDKAHFGTYWTPTLMLLVPFTCVVSAHFLFGEILGFVPLSPEVTTVWIVGSTIFWVAGHSLRQLWTGGSQLSFSINAAPDIHLQDRVKLWSVCGGFVSIVLLVHAYGFLQQMGGISAIASQDFQDQWGLGWPAHVRTGLIVIMIMTLGTTNRWSYSIVTSLILMFLVILLYQSKGALLAPLIAGSICRVLNGRYIPKASHFLGAVAASFALFQLIYLLGWAVFDPSSLLKGEVYVFYSLHFMSYLFSGVLGLSEALRLGATWLNADGLVLIAPFHNLFGVVFDVPSILVAALAQDHFVEIAKHGGSSNVNTFLGTILLAAGPLYGAIVVAAVSVISHAMFIGWASSRNRWLLVAYSYWGSLLVFGWFEYFFWLLSCIELPVFCLIFAMAEEYLSPGGDIKTRSASTVGRVVSPK